MGGIALGKAVVSSGLLDTMDVGIRHLVSGLELYQVVLALSAVVLVCSFHDYLRVVCVPDRITVGQGCVNIYQSYYCECTSRTYRFRSGEKPTNLSPSV